MTPVKLQPFTGWRCLSCGHRAPAEPKPALDCCKHPVLMLVSVEVVDEFHYRALPRDPADGQEATG